MLARRVLAALAIAAALAAGTCSAQELGESQGSPETIQIGLSTDRVAITADFSGADLTIFGALENADPLVSRQGRYDVIVVLEGPARPVVVRRKDRFLGMWVNMDSETFVNVPVSYSMATTRALRDIAGPESYDQLALGLENIHLEPLDAEGDPRRIDEFERALRERKAATGLFSIRIGGVEFLSQSLFRATLNLAPNVPVGSHRARAFLFRGGVFVRENSAPLAIVKSGVEQRIARTAQDFGFAYGLLAVTTAIVTGWLGRLLFRRD